MPLCGRIRGAEWARLQRYTTPRDDSPRCGVTRFLSLAIVSTCTSALPRVILQKTHQSRSKKHHAMTASHSN